jgi:hypothetical protein
MSYRITFEPVPSPIPIEVRVRKLLKIGLRQCGLRATAIEPKADGTSTAGTGHLSPDRRKRVGGIKG